MYINNSSFGGYENVHILYDMLKVIIETEDESWKTALSTVQGIYLISDNTNGKLYVGAAYGQENFWQRWSAYAMTGHGDNQDLKILYNSYGIEYFSNLCYTILETFKNTVDKEEIQNREVYWKTVLLSREFGYNKN